MLDRIDNVACDDGAAVTAMLPVDSPGEVRMIDGSALPAFHGFDQLIERLPPAITVVHRRELRGFGLALGRVPDAGGGAVYEVVVRAN